MKRAAFSVFRTFPAISLAISIGLGVSLACWGIARFRFHDPRPKLFLLGDSNIGNYRLDPGDRLEDAWQREEPGLRVENWAEPGATPLDFFLQYCRGTLLAGRPQRVVIALEPQKLLPGVRPHRFDEGGVNLRWLPFSRQGWELWRRLTPEERNVAVAQKASLPLYAIADCVRSLWLRWIQWPRERAKMLAAGDERRRKIEAKAVERAEREETEEIPGDRELAELAYAQDAAFVLAALRAEGVETRVILMPYGNPEINRKTCSPSLLAKHDTLVVRMRRWLDRQQVDYVNLNAPEELERFPPSVWDDQDHLKDPAAIAYIARRSR